jgi:hypothetical protein
MEKKINEKKAVAIKAFCSCHDHAEPFSNSGCKSSTLFWLILEPSEADMRLTEMARFFWGHFLKSTEFIVVRAQKSF